MQDISGVETKIRAYEAPLLNVPSPDHRIYLDGIGLLPASISPADLIAAGISNLPQQDGTPSSAAYLAVYTDGEVSLFTVEDATGASSIAYLGPHAVAPTLNNKGDLLIAGNTYFNTTNNQTYVFTSSGVWRLFGQVYPATIAVYKFTITVGTGLLVGYDDLGNELLFDIPGGDAVSLYINGARQVGGVDYILHSDQSITFPVPLISGNVVEVQVFGHPETTFTTSPAVIDTDLWVQDGTAKTFEVRSVAGILISPGSTANCMVSKNDVILNPLVDFVVFGTNISFADAPAVDDVMWMVVGTPAGPSSDVIECLRREIGTVANKTYILDLKAVKPYRISSLVRKVLTSGSVTAKIQIDGLDVTGLTALSCTTAETETFATANNSVALGQTVSLVTSANAAALDLCLSLNILT